MQVNTKWETAMLPIAGGMTGYSETDALPGGAA
jgi:hypothetical protein